MRAVAGIGLHFRILTMFLCLHGALAGQVTDTLGTPAEITYTDSAVGARANDSNEHRLTLRDFRTLARVLRVSMELRKTIRTDYADLPLMKGWHPLIGYQYQGFGTMQAGIGYGHRHLFKPLAYTNAHINIVWAPNRSDWMNTGLGAGITRSQNIVFYGMEASWFRVPVHGSGYVIRPEVGFSFLGAWNIGYGYNIFIGERPPDFGPHAFVFRYTQQFLIRSAQRKYREVNYILNRDRARWEAFWREVKKTEDK